MVSDGMQLARDDPPLAELSFASGSCRFVDERRSRLAVRALPATRGGVTMALALDQNARQKIAWMVEELPSEFDGEFDGRQIEELMADSVARLAETAAVVDFIPLMAYRFTRERLNALTRA